MTCSLLDLSHSDILTLRAGIAAENTAARRGVQLPENASPNFSPIASEQVDSAINGVVFNQADIESVWNSTLGN